MLSASHSISRHVVGIIGRWSAMLQQGDDMLSGCCRKIGRVNTRLVKQVHCDGKDPLPNPRVARQVASRIRNRRRDAGARVQAYRCPFCEHWHVGAVPSNAPSTRR